MLTKLSPPNEIIKGKLSARHIQKVLLIGIVLGFLHFLYFQPQEQIVAHFL